jgi:hypothetical protein
MKNVAFFIVLSLITFKCDSGINKNRGELTKDNLVVEPSSSSRIINSMIGIRNTHDFDMGIVTVVFTDGTTASVHVAGKGDFVVVENDPRTPERIILEQMGIIHNATTSEGTPIIYPDGYHGQFYRANSNKIHKVTADSIPVAGKPWWWYIFNSTP